MLATTDVLLDRWLAEAPDLPHDPAEALRSDAFYAEATGPDAAVLRYALVPILPPGGASTARAMLVLRAQEMVPGVPDELLVAVISGKRVFIASSPVKAKVASGIFHVEGGRNYARTRPDRCYASAEAAEADGLRRSKT